MWLVDKPGLGLYPVEVLVWELLHIRVVLFYSRGYVVALQDERSRVRFPMVSLEFFIDIFLPAALWPWG